MMPLTCQIEPTYDRILLKSSTFFWLCQLPILGLGDQFRRQDWPIDLPGDITAESRQHRGCM